MITKDEKDLMSTYYVKPDGNDSADGLSDATAWKTIRKVNKTVSKSGSRVLFKRCGVWQMERLYIDWPNATIGEY